ncbi:hypothetical protein JCM19231_4406 [Vibrio ishigakensis]|uniref:Uncharacterized protein n=1 Tax=Vibrio ishigakensis TaxID=1481914 RepID=A0A0B8P1L2_9VIBR|nr:hypothetical protein JCM19231_4406 [Vibrio ishigakensis]
MPINMAMMTLKKLNQCPQLTSLETRSAYELPLFTMKFGSYISA